MKKVLAALVIGMILCAAAPLFAQGPFADVPTDHWAYEAVNQLQQDGILIGYPDGTFGGKRAMTRYEFAVAVARMIPIITGKITPAGPGAIDTSKFVTRDELANYATKADLAGLAKQSDVDALRKLVDEFRDELAALGVDVDALKRDVAALNDRVCALEKEMSRVKWNGVVDAIGESSSVNTGPSFFNRDDRISTNTSLLRNISALENVDLKLRGTLTDNAAANVMAVAGNYLSWIGSADDYSVFTRPDSKATGLTDRAALWFANVDMAFGTGNITVGRQPIQWNPYLLKMIDVDSYTNIEFTDSGNYPMDAARLLARFGGVKVDLFASKNNENPFLVNGLTGQPTSGLYNTNPLVDAAFGAPVTPGVFNVVGGHAAGGLDLIDQTAGARIMLGTPFKGNLGLSYLQGAGPVAVSAVTGGTYDQFRAFGADLNFTIGKFLIAAQWAQNDTLGTGATDDLTDDNQAIDAKVGFGLGKLGINAGWKRIERNYAAPGYWDKLGRWTNPSNVEGPFGQLSYGLTPSVNLVAEGAWFSGVDTFAGLPAVIDDDDDNILHVQGGLKWGLSNTNSVDLGVEWVDWQPSEAGSDNSHEVYYNIGWGYQVNPSAGFKLCYQIARYNPGPGAVVPYAGLYQGNTAVAQFGVKF